MNTTSFSPTKETEKLFPFSVYLVTVPNDIEAQMISSALLGDKLIACANILGGAKKQLYSMYTWQGEIAKDDELLLVMKSRTELLDEIITKVKTLASFDIPEVIAQPLLGGSSDYLKWVLENTKKRGEEVRKKESDSGEVNKKPSDT